MTGFELLDKLMGRIAKLENGSGTSFDEALNNATEAIFLRLWARRSDLAQEKFAEAGTTEHSFLLPLDFRGFAEDPYLINSAGSKLALVPLPTGGERELTGVNHFPKYYRAIGRTFDLYPHDGGEWMLRGKYFSSPGEIQLVDDLPWHGMLDNLIGDAAVAAVRFGGLTAMLANKEFIMTMDQALEGLLTSRSNPAPRRVRPHNF